MKRLKLSERALGMLVARYQAVLRKMAVLNCSIRLNGLRTAAVAFVTAAVLSLHGDVMAAEYAIGAPVPGVHNYTSLEELRQANITFVDGDVITVYNNDNSLTAALDVGGATVTLCPALGAAVTLAPAPGTTGSRLVETGSGALAVAAGITLDGFSSSAGGAAVLFGGSKMTVDGAMFANNGALDGSGGAVQVQDGSELIVSNTQFADNTAAKSGGALNVAAGSNAAVDTGDFSGNMALWGGAAHIDDSDVTVKRSLFAGNQAQKGDGSGGSGGAIYVKNNSTLTIADSHFSGNVTNGWGGALYADTVANVITVADSRFTGNRADYDNVNNGGHGGALMLWDSAMTVASSVFEGNRADNYGGAAAVRGSSSLTVTDSLFRGNEAVNGDGGAVQLYSSNLMANNTLFINNYAGETGGAVFLHTSGSGEENSITLNTSNGNLSLFSGNHINAQVRTGNSLWMQAQDNAVARLRVDGNGILDMRDPLVVAIVSGLHGGTADITKTGGGVWKLGGENLIFATEFHIDQGMLDMYDRATILAGDDSGLTLKTGAQINLRGSNTFEIGDGTITFQSGSTLGFDLSGGVADGNAGATMNLKLRGAGGGTLTLPAGGETLNIDILALNGDGTNQTYTLVDSVAVTGDITTAANFNLTFRGEDFAGTRANTTSLASTTPDKLLLTTDAQNGEVRWSSNAGSDWNATAGNWSGIDNSGAGGADLSGATQFLHGDAVIFDNAAGGSIAIQAAGVQVTARGANPGLTIKDGDWRFHGGRLEGGAILLAGSGSLTFDTRVLEQDIKVAATARAALSAAAGSTLSLVGRQANNGGAVYGEAGSVFALKGDGAIKFSANQAAGFGGAIYSGGALAIESGDNMFANNKAGGFGGAIYALDTVTLIADGGDITFRDNTHARNCGVSSANAVYLANTSTLTLGAAAGRSIYFYDPVEAGSGADTTVVINSGSGQSGVVQFDTYQSAINGSTTVLNGTLSLTGGAVYGADGNSGSFTLESSSMLSSDAAGNTINAGAITLNTGSVTAVELSQDRHLTLNAGTVALGGTLDILGIGDGSDPEAARTLTAIATTGNLSGSFSKLIAGGMAQTGSLADRFLNYAYIEPDAPTGQINVTLGGLVWNNQGSSGAHGTFDVATNFTVAQTLADNLTAGAYLNGWDGTSLKKQGGGTLTLTGANTYGGGTTVAAGTLVAGNALALGGDVTVAAGATLAATGDLMLRSLTNDGGFIFVDAATMQRRLSLDRYSGGGTIGLTAAASASEQWSDHVTFSQTPADRVNIRFTFTPDSSAAYLPAEGLEFANLTGGSGTADTFTLQNKDALAGARQLKITTADNQTYFVSASFDPGLAKVYSETGAAALAQASGGLHDRLFLRGLGEAARGAAGGETGVFASMGRSDHRYETGSHADIDGSRLILALARQSGNATYGLFGQRFSGDYKTTHQALVSGGRQNIHADGSLKQHDFGIFGEYRPGGQAAGEVGLAYQAVVRAGRSIQEIQADNASAGTRFNAGRNVFGAGIGAEYTGPTTAGSRTDYYGHLIYTRLGSERITDSIGQDIRLDSAGSTRLLTGLRVSANLDKRVSYFYGAAVDYEFSGETGAVIDGEKAASARLEGLSGLLELGFSAKQSDNLTIDGSVTGYLGKKRGFAGSLTVNCKF